MEHRSSLNYSGSSPGNSSRGTPDSSKSKAKPSPLLPPWFREIGDSMKTKKRELVNHATNLYSSSPQPIFTPPPPPLQHNVEEAARNVDQLLSIFPNWDASTLQLLLEAHEFVLNDAITAVLQMEESTEQENMMRSTQSLPFAYVVKNPLPDDFLRVPGELAASPSRSGPCSGSSAIFEVDDVFDDTASLPMHPDDLTRQESSYAHDDGTLYGREFLDGGDDFGDHDASSPAGGAVPLAIPVVSPLAEDDVSSDRRRFQRPRRLGRPSSRTDSLFAKLTVIKRSKLDIVSAEDRIRTREPHRLLDCLTKASVLYRNGLIASDELENLRSMILTRMSTKAPAESASQTGGPGTTACATSNTMITDHQWNCLVLKCKSIRHALSIRIINAITTSQHTASATEYEIRTSDLETGVVVFTRRRFKEFHKFHRKLTALTTRVNGFPFPSRQTGLSKKEDFRVAAQRQPALEAYLRLVASLVTPSPLTIARANALALLQTFLALPDSATLFHNTTQPATRILRVYAFHVLQDATTPEGKVCRKFLAKPIATTAALDELGQVLDNVQAYMLDHRMDDMKAHVGAFAADEASRRADDAAEVVSGWISDAIRHEVEECVCVPVLPVLWTALEASMKTKETAMKTRMIRLAGQPQEAFEIAENTLSPSQWWDAIRTLKEVDAMYLPVDKMRKLLECALTIHRTFQREHGDAHVLSGDDFLPIFIYVIVHAHLTNPLVLLRVLNVLSDPEKRMGESGYYLASYEAALEHLMADDSCE